MKKNLSGTSIVESLVVMLIIVTGITGMYSIFTQSQKLSNTTENRIEAIQIAREWIEAFTNIRNTNWILYAADYKNCWNTFNYNSACIGNNTFTTDMIHSWSYTITQDPTTSRWLLGLQTSWDHTDSWYRNRFEVFKDWDWLYTQSSWTSFKPLFTREIIIQYLEDNIDSAPDWKSSVSIDSNDEKIKVISRVQWVDSSKDTPYTVELDTILTNWKNKAN